MKRIPVNNIDNSNINLPQEYLDKLKSMFQTVVEFLNNNNIKYFIDGGTLLGCVRDGGQIPYDDDIDIGMDVKNFFQFRKIMNSLKSFGFEIIDQPDDIIKIYDYQNLYVRNTTNGETDPRCACIDIFLYIEKKKQYMLSQKANRDIFKNCFYDKKDLFPLKEYNYGDLKVTGANNPEPYLTSYYGDWKARVFYMY